jgi:hypothetical protein
LAERQLGWTPTAGRWLRRVRSPAMN